MLQQKETEHKDTILQLNKDFNNTLQLELKKQQKQNDKIINELHNKNKYYNQQIISLINHSLIDDTNALGQSTTNGNINNKQIVIEQYYSNEADEFVVVDDKEEYTQ
eukprot:UN04419